MRLLLILACALQLQGATYYIAASGGNDANPGTSGSRFATFDHAWTHMSAGDTLIVGDGTYNQRIAPTVSGTAQAHLTIQAENDGAAIIDVQGAMDAAITIGGPLVSYAEIHYVDIKGIVAMNAGQVDNLSGVIYIWGHNNTLQRVSAYNADTDVNSSVIWVLGNDNLIEDCVFGGSGRKMVLIFVPNTRNIVRRTFAAWQEWRGGGTYDPGAWPWGDQFDIYNASNNIIENSIAYGMSPGPGSGFELQQQVVGGNTTGNALLGTMVIRQGKKWNGDDMTWPCPNPNNTGMDCQDLAGNVRQAYPIRGTTVENNLLQDVFAWGNAGAALHATAAGTSNSLIRATFINNGLGSGESGQEYDTGSLDHFDTFTDSYIEGTAYQGSGARLQYRYESTFSGDTAVPTLTSTLLWPWPMEDRINAEFAAYLYPTWGTTNPELEDFSVTTTMQTIFNTLGAQNPNPPRSSMSGGKITGGRLQ